MISIALGISPPEKFADEILPSRNLSFKLILKFVEIFSFFLNILVYILCLLQISRKYADLRKLVKNIAYPRPRSS